MKLLIHDLEEENFRKLLPSTIDNITIMAADDSAHHCVGCFGCWIKTPGACLIRDKYGDMGEQLSKYDEIIILSKCYYGGFSPLIKTVMDRSISYIHPYFEIRSGEMHHRRRYSNHFDLKVWFYGEDITVQEKQTAEELIKANAINLACSAQPVTFIPNIEVIRYLTF